MFLRTVRAGFVGDLFCQIDLCAGSDSRMLNYLFFGVMKIILGQNKINNHINMNEIPFNQVKPFYNDNEFLIAFEGMLKKYNKGVFSVDDILMESVKNGGVDMINSENLSNFRDSQWNELTAHNKCSKENTSS